MEAWATEMKIHINLGSDVYNESLQTLKIAGNAKEIIAEEVRPRVLKPTRFSRCLAEDLTPSTMENETALRTETAKLQQDLAEARLIIKDAKADYKAVQDENQELRDIIKSLRKDNAVLQDQLDAEVEYNRAAIEIDRRRIEELEGECRKLTAVSPMA